MIEPTPNPETRIALFQHKESGCTFHTNEWWFVITDVVAALTDSLDALDYLKQMRKRDPDLAAVLQGGGQFVPPPLGLEFDTAGGGRRYRLDVRGRLGWRARMTALRSVVSRLGLADVRAFGLTWEDCEQLLGELGYAARVDVVMA